MAIERNMDLEKYLVALKAKGVDTQEVENRLNQIISSNASVLLPEAQ